MQKKKVYTRKNRAKQQVEAAQQQCNPKLIIGSPKSADIYAVLDAAKSSKKKADEPRQRKATEKEKRSFDESTPVDEPAPRPTTSKGTSTSTTASPSRTSFVFRSAREIEEARVDAKSERIKKGREEAREARSSLAGSPTKFRMGSTLYHARPRPFTRDTTIGDYFPSYDRWATSNTGAHHYDFDRHNAELEELDRSGRRARSASGGLGIVNRSWATSPVTSPVLSSRPAFKREGLQNLGNTCYMNAVLQSLLSLETFVSDMNRDEFIQALPYTSFYQALLQIAVEMRREKHGIINPWPVKDAVARMAKQFSDWMQQDAHEFLVSCLDQLEGEIDKIGQDSREKAKAEVGASSSSSTLVILSEEEKQAERVRNDKCPIFLNFESEVEHTFTCRNPACENVARKPEIFRDFSLEIIEPPPGASETDKRSNKPSVQDLVKFWFQGDEVVEMRCGKCEEAGEADVGHNFLRLPRVLILHLKRFKPLPTDIFTIRKLQDMVRLNKTIDLGFCCDRRTFDPFAPGPLNLPSHDAAFSPTSRSPSSSHSPSSAPSPSPSSPFSTSVASVKSSEFKVPAPHSKVVVPPTSSFPTGGAKGGERIDDDLSTIIEGSLANNKRQRTQSSDSTSTSTNGTKLSEEEMMARALKESEMTFAAVEQAKEEERIRKEQEELDMAIALSLEEGQDDEQRVSMKRKRSTNATEHPLSSERVPTETTRASHAASPLRVSRIFDDDAADQQEWREPRDKCNALYHLRSIVVHWGAKASMGHYTSYVHNPTSGQWKEYNDDRVYELKESAALGEQAEKNGYLLFYVHDSVQHPARSQKAATSEATMGAGVAKIRKGKEKQEADEEEERERVTMDVMTNSVEEKKEKKTKKPYNFDDAMDACSNAAEDSDDILNLSFFGDLANSSTNGAASAEPHKRDEEERKTTQSRRVDEDARAATRTVTVTKPAREDGRTNGNREAKEDSADDEDEELKRAIALSLAEATEKDAKAKAEEEAKRRKRADEQERKASVAVGGGDEEESGLEDKRKRRKRQAP